MRIGRMGIGGSGLCRLVGGIGMGIGILLLTGRRVGGLVGDRFVRCWRLLGVVAEVLVQPEQVRAAFVRSLRCVVAYSGVALAEQI